MVHRQDIVPRNLRVELCLRALGIYLLPVWEEIRVYNQSSWAGEFDEQQARESSFVWVGEHEENLLSRGVMWAPRAKEAHIHNEDGREREVERR